MKFADRIKAFFGISSATEIGFFDELADLLIEGDLGAAFASKIAEELKMISRKRGKTDQVALRTELKHILSSYGKEALIIPDSSRLNVFLLLGVNGVGKTTTCAKLAQFYRKKGFVTGAILAAGDTFRAAAIDQLKIHGEKLGVRVVAQRLGSDPGAVLYDAIDAARADAIPLVIADTAGRMHTRIDLIRELEKIDRVVAARATDASYKRLLVIDATTGQNGLRQAEIFNTAVPLDGIILTKYDSSARGGIAIAIAKEFGIPTAFIGKGEAYEDIEVFSLASFLDDFVGVDR